MPVAAVIAGGMPSMSSGSMTAACAAMRAVPPTLNLIARSGSVIDRPERHLAPGAGRGRHGDERRDAPLDGVVSPLVPRDRAAVDGHHPDRLGDVHGRAAADGDEAVAALGGVHRGRAVDEGDVRIGAHLGEDGRAGKLRQGRGGEPGVHHARIGHDERPGDAEPGHELSQLGERAGPVHQPGRRVDGAYRLDLDAHLAPSAGSAVARARPHPSPHAAPRPRQAQVSPST